MDIISLCKQFFIDLEEADSDTEPDEEDIARLIKEKFDYNRVKYVSINYDFESLVYQCHRGNDIDYFKYAAEESADEKILQ